MRGVSFSLGRPFPDPTLPAYIPATSRPQGAQTLLRSGRSPACPPRAPARGTTRDLKGWTMTGGTGLCEPPGRIGIGVNPRLFEGETP